MKRYNVTATEPDKRGLWLTDGKTDKVYKVQAHNHGKWYDMRSFRDFDSATEYAQQFRKWRIK